MSFQQITIVGHLGNDPEMRYTPTGVPVTSFSVAVSRNWTDQSGQRQEKTTWFRVSAWRKLAETVSQYATKGRLVLVAGEMEETRIWTDKEGSARASLEVTAQNVRFLGGRPDGAGHDSESASSERSNEGPSSGSNSGGGSSSGGAGHASDEDIPF